MKGGYNTKKSESLDEDNDAKCLSEKSEEYGREILDKYIEYWGLNRLKESEQKKNDFYYLYFPINTLSLLIEMREKDIVDKNYEVEKKQEFDDYIEEKIQRHSPD